MRPDFGGLTLAPSVPGSWDRFEIEKDFRGSHLHILVHNEGHRESGCRRMLVNGKEMESNYIPAELLTDVTEVELWM